MLNIIAFISGLILGFALSLLWFSVKIETLKEEFYTIFKLANKTEDLK